MPHSARSSSIIKMRGATGPRLAMRENASPQRRPWTSLACGSLRGLPDPARMETLVLLRALPTLLGRELRGCFRERGDHALRGAVEERDAIGAQRFEARRVDLGRHERVAEGLVAPPAAPLARTQAR